MDLFRTAIVCGALALVSGFVSPRGIVGYIVLSALLFVFAISCYTASSALGAGARYLLGRRARR